MSSLQGRVMEEKLREASCLGDVEMAVKLLQIGVDVNSKNVINGWTALHWACKRSHIPIVTLLLRNGADKTVENTTGETPIDLTTNLQIKSLLENGISDVVLPDTTNAYQEKGKLDTDKTQFSIFDSKSYRSRSFEGDIVLKVRIANSPDPDFIEIEIHPEKMTYKGLILTCSEEFGLLPDQQKKAIHLRGMVCELVKQETKDNSIIACQKQNDEWSIEIIKVRKLPDTRMRNDKDIQRLKQWQELELVTQDGVAGSTNIYQPITNKNQTVLY